MKKTLTCLLALALVMALTACGAENEGGFGNGFNTSWGSSAAEEEKSGEELPEEDKSGETEKTPEEAPPKEPAQEETPAADSGLRPEFKAAMDSYEAFYDDYCAFMEEYNRNPSDLKLLAEYADMMGKLADMEEKFDAWEGEDLNNKELACYMEVNSRVTQKLLAVLD